MFSTSQFFCYIQKLTLLTNTRVYQINSIMHAHHASAGSKFFQPLYRVPLTKNTLKREKVATTTTTSTNTNLNKNRDILTVESIFSFIKKICSTIFQILRYLSISVYKQVSYVIN